MVYIERKINDQRLIDSGKYYLLLSKSLNIHRESKMADFVWFFFSFYRMEANSMIVLKKTFICGLKKEIYFAEK